MTSKRDAACRLAKAGFRVFPLTPNGKTPALEGDWRRAASKDPARVAEMWTCPITDAERDYNIGIALDPDLLVADVDVRDGKQGAKSLALLEAIYDALPETQTVTTASGGLHRYYRTPTPVRNSASLVGQNIDIKSHGGFVVGRGSTIDGVAYTSNEAAIVDAPDWLLTLAGEAKPRPAHSEAPVVELDGQSATARAVEYLQRTAPDAGTYAVAARVKDFGVSQEKCIELMLDHWPPAEAKGEEHVSFRVNNAYRYGQNAPGIASAEAEFEAVEIDVKQKGKRKGLYATAWPLAKPEMEQLYLIDGVLDAGSLIVTYGDSNTGKTYIAMDQAYHVAAGLPWNGHKVKQGLVIYVAAEGGSGFFRRVAAFKKHYGDTPVPFYTVPCSVDLFADNGDTAKLVRLIKECEAEAGAKSVLIVVDTLARAMAGGDENTSTDMGKFVANCDRIRAATGAALNVVHHTGKDKAKGARGSSALRAATDTEIEIDVGSFTMTKQRDMGRAESLRFELVPLEIGQRSDGKAVTACVVRWLAENEFNVELSPLARQMLDVLEGLIDARLDELEGQDGAGKVTKSDAKIEWKEWQSCCLSCLNGARGKSISRSVLFRGRLELSQSGKVHKDIHNQWFIQ